MPTVDETAKVMFGMGRMNPMTMLQIFREINSLLNMFKARKSQTAVSDINFTGQHTDIALVAENGKLNAEEIEKITDNQLRENVQKSFSEAVQNGYLDYDAKARDFTVTQKGLEHINSEAFMKQFEKDRLQKLSENKAQVNLRGNGTDLNVFRFTDSISLNHLAHTDPVAFKRVQEYFYECEKYGFVNISSDGIVTATEKCRKYLEQNPMKEFDIRKITPDNVKQVADELRKTSSETAKNTFGNLLDKAEDGVNVATKTVSFVSGESKGTDVAAEGAKFASQQGTKKLRDEAAKKAAERAAKKAAAKGASQAAAKAGTTVAAGSVSMGIGAAVSAVVDLTSQGAKKLTDFNTQNHKHTLNTHR